MKWAFIENEIFQVDLSRFDVRMDRERDCQNGIAGLLPPLLRADGQLFQRFKTSPLYDF